MNSVNCISNTKNFISSFNIKSLPAVIDKYNLLISEFFLCAIENIAIQNDKYYIFVIQRGLETLKHCFKMIYMYTKNIELTMYHCKKAFCYYIEFIGQIGDDNNSYLQLNSKDAALFVYKKTVFEIDNNFRKKFVLPSEELIYLDVMTSIIDIYHEIVMNIISKEDDLINKKESVVHFTLQKTSKIIDKIFIKDMSLEENLKNLKIVLFFIYAIKEIFEDNITYCNVCECFIKKLRKKCITIDKLREKLFRNDLSLYVKSYTPLRFVNWLFNHI